MMSKRMKLMTESDYEKLVRRGNEHDLAHNSASVNSFHHRKTNSSSILNLVNLSDDIKLALFNTVVKGLRTQFEQLSQEPVPVIIKEQILEKKHKTVEQPQLSEDHKLDVFLQDLPVGLTEEDDALLMLIPPKYRPSARSIMKMLHRDKKEVYWTPNGSVLFEGVPRTGANIVDLLSFVLNPSTNDSVPPPGTNSFLYVLKKLSIPTTLMKPKLRGKIPRLSIGTLESQRTPMPTSVTRISQAEALATSNEIAASPADPNPSTDLPFSTPTGWATFRRN